MRRSCPRRVGRFRRTWSSSWSSARVPRARRRGVAAPGRVPAVSSGCHCTARSHAAVELEPFDDAVVGARDDAQAVADLVDRLVVMARARDARRAHHLGEQRARRRRRCSCCAPAAGLAGPAVRARRRGASGMCWYSVPPSATLSTWKPRQIASVGIAAVDRGVARARARSRRSARSTPYTLGVRLLAVAGGIDVGAAGEHERVDAVEQRARVADRGRRRRGWPPARTTASRYARGDAVAPAYGHFSRVAQPAARSTSDRAARGSPLVEVSAAFPVGDRRG